MLVPFGGLGDGLNTRFSHAPHPHPLPPRGAGAGRRGSRRARWRAARGGARSEPLTRLGAGAWPPPTGAPTFDTRRAVLQITQQVIEGGGGGGNVGIGGRGGAYILRKFPAA